MDAVYRAHRKFGGIFPLKQWWLWGFWKLVKPSPSQEIVCITLKDQCHLSTQAQLKYAAA